MPTRIRFFFHVTQILSSEFRIEEKCNGLLASWGAWLLSETPTTTVVYYELKSTIQMFTENSPKMDEDEGCRSVCLHEISNPNEFCRGSTEKREMSVEMDDI